jgi:predicted flap endonuclease-1-like 5' DNA nuclease
MGLLDTIRSWLGIGGNGSDRGEQVERRTTDVRVEHDPDESADVDATSEALVKGTDDSPEHAGADGPGEPGEPDEAATAGTDAAASTDSLTEEPPEPDAATEPTEPAEGTTVTDHAGTEREAAEPAEAAGPTPDEPDVDLESEDATPEPSTETGVAESGSVAEPEEPDETDGTDDETDAGSEPIESISGIGQAYGKRLSDAGVETVADLAGADSAELADASGISEKRITDWQEAADDRLG